MKIAIIYYSTYGHISSMAEAVKAGVEKSGKASEVAIFQVPETLPKEVLAKMHAPAKASYPLATQETLVNYDAFIFGYPTRFGNLPAQMSEYLGETGGLWASGALARKPVAFFTSTSSSGGGQEVTLRNFLSYAAHHGMVYIPLGYGPAFADLTNLSEVHGGTPYGAASFAGPDGSRQPSDLEKRIASTQGETFAASAIKFVSSKSGSNATAAKTAEKPVEKSTEKPVEKSTEAPAKETTKMPTEKTTQEARATQSKPSENKEEKSGCAKCVIM